MDLISPAKKQYKANLHSHSTMSDGRLTPQQLKDAYKARGYSILAITDHDYPVDHSDLSEKDFLLITGYESIAYERIREDWTGLFIPMIHMNLFARNPHNLTMIDFDPLYCFYIPEDVLPSIPLAPDQKSREYSVSNINSFVRKAREAGFLVAYNHPSYNTEPFETLLAYQGFFSMEIANSDANTITGFEYNGELYNRLLSAGKRLFCHAADDNHNLAPEDSRGYDSFRSWTMILADDLSYDSVIRAMESGEMYASRGPSIYEASFEDGRLHVECSEAACIRAFYGSHKTTKTRFAPEGGTITSAEFEMPANLRYIRISVEDVNGKTADTRGFFRDELGLPPLEPARGTENGI